MPSTVDQPLVGRLKEIEGISAALFGERPGVVMLKGEAGVGKTTLARACQSLARERGLRVLMGHCYDTAPPAAFLPLIQMLSQAGQAGSEFVRKWTLDEAGGQKLGAAADTRPGAADPRTTLFALVGELLDEIAAAEKLLLIVEDLQWADPDSILLLNHLLDAHGDKISLLSTQRSDHRPTRSLATLLGRLEDKGLVINLSPLTKEESATLLRRELGPLRESEMEPLVDFSAGSPLLIVELAAHLRASGLLEGHAAAEALSLRRIPGRIAQVIDARLDDLPPPTLFALEAASVVGIEFDLSLLSSAAETDQGNVEDAVAGAVDEGLIELLEGNDSSRYAFRHPVFRERLLRSLPCTKRAASKVGSARPRWQPVWRQPSVPREYSPSTRLLAFGSWRAGALPEMR